MVAEALEAGALATLYHVRDRADAPIVAAASAAGVAVEAVGDELMAKLSSTVTPPGLVGVSPFVDIPLDRLPRSGGAVTVLCSVRDPGNAGTVLRSADASGASTVVFTDGSVDPYNPKTVRASAGSLFHVPVVRDADVGHTVDALRSSGHAVYAAAADGTAPLYSLDLTRPSVFLFGNEAWGLPEEVAALADVSVRVPLEGRAESLNLASAAAVCLFEAARQRGVPTARLEMEIEGIVKGAAHDIRSPAAATRSSALAMLMAGDGMSEEQRIAMLRGISHDADRMDLILKELVDAARISSGDVELAVEDVDLHDVADDIRSFTAAEEGHPEVLWEGEAGARVAADPTRLRTMILAFVEAAVWFAREGPIVIRTSNRPGYLRIEVSRGGAGLADDRVAELFRPRRPGEGSGSKIGLFVARGLAEAHGGTASARVVDGALLLSLELPVRA